MEEELLQTEKMTMKLNYPVFVLKERDKMIYVFFNEKDLKRTNTELLERNVFKDVTLIDAEGIFYKVKNTFKVKYIGIKGFSLLKKGRQILIDFELEKSPLSIEIKEFKQIIIDRIESNKNFWQSAWNITELTERIKRSYSYTEIAELIK